MSLAGCVVISAGFTGPAEAGVGWLCKRAAEKEGEALVRDFAASDILGTGLAFSLYTPLSCSFLSIVG